MEILLQKWAKGELITIEAIGYLTIVMLNYMLSN